MEHEHGHEPSHRQDREHKKAEHTLHGQQKKHLSSVHPAWYLVVGVVLCGTALVIWMLLV